jgi:hypothetical protein
MGNPFNDIKLKLTDKERELVESQRYAHVLVKLTTAYSKDNIWPSDSANEHFRQDITAGFKEMGLFVIKEAQSEQGYYKIIRSNGSDKTNLRINGNEQVGYLMQSDYSGILRALKSMDSIHDFMEEEYTAVSELNRKKLQKIMLNNAEEIAGVIAEGYDLDALKVSGTNNASGIANYPTARDFSESSAKIHIFGEINGHTPNAADVKVVNAITKKVADGETVNVQELAQSLGADIGQGQDKDDI